MHPVSLVSVSEELAAVQQRVATFLRPHLRHLVDVSPQEPNMRRFWQQGEITAAITRIEDQGPRADSPAHRTLGSANAAHDARKGPASEDAQHRAR